MDLGLKNKTVLVTASSKGIGKAVASAFASEDCNVAICSRNKEDLIKTAAEIKARYKTEPFWCVCDINKQRDIEAAVSSVKEEFGKINILVNNCGGPAPGYFRDLSDMNWQTAFEQVLLSAVRFCNLVIPDMILNEWGRVINIVSITVKQPVDNLILSNSLRSGVVAFTKSISNEVAKFNVTANSLAPGFTLTNRLYELAVERAKREKISHEEVLAEMAKQIPMNRLALPDEIASVAVFLASENAGYLTGNVIHVDGGWVKGY